MFTQFEEKGKIFTNVVTKKPVHVHIQTNLHLIRGKVHIRPDERLKDELNHPESFLAVTDAAIFNHDGKKLFNCKFIAVNRTHVVWLLQDDEIKKSEESQ
jgi:hypothetical protein